MDTVAIISITFVVGALLGGTLGVFIGSKYVEVDTMKMVKEYQDFIIRQEDEYEG